MRRKRGSLIRQITLPAEPSELLLERVNEEQMPLAIASLFTLFGVDPAHPQRDRWLWEAMATCMFPQLATPVPKPKRRGRPPAKTSKVTPERRAAMAEAWDRYVRIYGRNTPKASLYLKFIKDMPEHSVMKGRGDMLYPISFDTFIKHVRLGRLKNSPQTSKPVAYQRMSVEAKAIYDALDYIPERTPLSACEGVNPIKLQSIRPIFYINLLRERLLKLNTSTEEGKSVLADIAAEVERLVPEEICVGGMLKLTIRPFWRREMRRRRKKAK